MVIDAENQVLGRIASFAAKKALQGEEITVVNAEKAIIVGNKKSTYKKFRGRVDMHAKGNPEKGPKMSRMPDRILRRAIRGMLPWKSSRGKKALRLVKVHIGIPKELQREKLEKPKNSEFKGVQNFVALGELCKLLGAKW